VYYGAAMTEAISCQDEDVYIVGGANSAGQAAMYFARYARRVTMIVRAADLAAGMSHYLVEQIAGTPNIDVRTNASIAEAHGEVSLDALTIADAATGQSERVPASALFIFIGAQPRTDWLAGIVARDSRGFVLAGPDLPRDDNGRVIGWPVDRDPYLLETSVPGIFVAGDVRHASVKRVASGVGEGAIAVSFVHQYLSQTKV
jgi:thioredoxin reductase (NADPH)